MSDCKFCGKEVVSKEGRKPKEFCNGNCRNKFYYKQAAAVRTPKKIGRPKKDELVFQQAKSRRMGQKGFINMVEKIDSKINFKDTTSKHNGQLVHYFCIPGAKSLHQLNEERKQLK